jgi:hypothetical protein
MSQKPFQPTPQHQAPILQVVQEIGLNCNWKKAYMCKLVNTPTCVGFRVYNTKSNLVLVVDSSSIFFLGYGRYKHDMKRV